MSFLHRLFAIALVALCLTHPATAALYKFDYLQCRFEVQVRGAGPLQVQVLDAREQVRDGSKPTHWVGYIRGGVGNAWSVHTKSGDPLATDIRQNLSQAFREAGFAMPASGSNGAVQAGMPTVRLTLHHWHTDQVSSFAAKWTDVYYDLELSVLSATGAVLATKRVSGKEPVKGKNYNAFGTGKNKSQAEAIGSLSDLVNGMLAAPEVQAALTGGAATPGSPTTRRPDAPARNDEATPPQPGSTAARLAEIKKLRDDGEITEAEYQAMRKKILGL